MQAKDILYRTQKLFQRLLDFVNKNLTYKETFTYYEPTVIYSFSHYGSPIAPIHIGGQRKIHAVECSLTLYNPNKRPKILKNVLMVAQVENHSYPLIPILKDCDHSQFNYFIPSRSYLTLSWQAFAMQLPKEKLEPGMIDIAFPQFPITFEITYCDKYNRKIKFPLKTTQSTVLKIQDLVLN